MDEQGQLLDEQGNMFVMDYYGDAVEQMLEAPGLVFTDAHWAVEKALELDANPQTVMANAEAILTFVRKHNDPQDSGSAREDSSDDPAPRRTWR